MIAPNETSYNICVLRATELPSFGSIVMGSSSLLTILIFSLSTRAFTIHSSLFTGKLVLPGAPWGRTCRCCRRPTWSRTSWPSSRWPWGSPRHPCRHSPCHARKSGTQTAPQFCKMKNMIINSIRNQLELVLMNKSLFDTKNNDNYVDLLNLVLGLFELFLRIFQAF